MEESGSNSRCSTCDSLLVIKVKLHRPTVDDATVGIAVFGDDVHHVPSSCYTGKASANNRNLKRLLVRAGSRQGMVGHSRHRRVSNGFLPTRVQPPGVTPEHFAEVARRHASVEHTSEVSSRLKRSRWSSILCTALTVTCRQVPHALSSLCTISACTYFRNSRIMPYGMMKSISFPSEPPRARQKKDLQSRLVRCLH